MWHDTNSVTQHCFRSGDACSSPEKTPEETLIRSPVNGWGIPWETLSKEVCNLTFQIQCKGETIPTHKHLFVFLEWTVYDFFSLKRCQRTCWVHVILNNYWQKLSEIKCWDYNLEYLLLFTVECSAKIKNFTLSFIFPAAEASLALFALYIICYDIVLSRWEMYINSRQSDDSLMVVVMACRPPDMWKWTLLRNFSASSPRF